MIPAEWNGKNVLAERADAAVVGVSLRLPASESELARAYGFSAPGMYWARYFEKLPGIRFFPDPRWRDAKVHIQGWSHLHSGKPVLSCLVERDQIDPRRWFGRSEQRALDMDAVELMTLCKEAGWNYDVRDGVAYRFCTVDELELTEGPPPEGAF